MSKRASERANQSQFQGILRNIKALYSRIIISVSCIARRKKARSTLYPVDGINPARVLCNLSFTGARGETRCVVCTCARVCASARVYVHVCARVCVHYRYRRVYAPAQTHAAHAHTRVDAAAASQLLTGRILFLCRTTFEMQIDCWPSPCKKPSN